MLTPEQLQEQAVVAERLAALGLPILTADKSRAYREGISAEWLAAIGYSGDGTLDGDGFLNSPKEGK